MSLPSELLNKLLDYVVEQDKDIDPRGFRLQANKDFLRQRLDIADLPGVELNVESDGDPVWLRVSRLEFTAPPQPTLGTQDGLALDAAVFQIAADPQGPQPSLSRERLEAQINTLRAGEAGDGGEAPSEEALTRLQTEYQLQLATYAIAWRSWAATEAPRRKTIELYSELFAYKHLMEAEETARPVELVWGLGVTSWLLRYEVRGSAAEKIAFNYPLLTQAMEISLAPKTMALEIRPRATEPQLEFDAFAACELANASETERAVKDMLAQAAETPPTPFDPASYSALLR